MVDSDKDQKTEAPTGKRLDEAREKGRLPVSREVSSWAIFLTILISVGWLFPIMGPQLIANLRPFLEKPDQFSLEQGGLQSLLFKLLLHIGLATGTVFGLLLLAAILSIGLQTGFYVNVSRLQPDFTKLSFITGIKNLFSISTVVEFIKSIAKLVIIGGISLLIFIPLIKHLPEYAGRDLMDIMKFSNTEIFHLITILLVIVTLIAISDLIFQRYNYYKSLRMTKQEVKDEHKQTEGDPMIKSRLRQIRLEKARRRMMAQVPKADVIITNPTHYAVALQYDNTRMAAPVLLAKGTDRVAERIREVAETNNIPLVSNPPLARALHETVEIDEAIKPEHYRAVAEVISYVYKLRKKMK